MKELNKDGVSRGRNARSLAVMLCLAVAGTGLSSQAWGLERNCTYDIRVKSNGSDIGSLDVPNGRVVSVGDQTAGGHLDAKRAAREFASRAARECLTQIMATPGVVPACAIVDNPRSGQAGMREMRLVDIRGASLDAICGQARQLGVGNRIRDYEIYIHVQGSSRDVRNQCANAFDGRQYYTLARGGAIQCANGLFQPRSAEGWTAWRDASASDVRQEARNICRVNHGGAPSRVTRWQVNDRDGRLRGFYSCG